MAELKKPNKAFTRKGTPPTEEEASNNIAERKTPENPITVMNEKSEEEKKPLNFKVPNSFRKRFKNYAVNNDVTMSELLEQCFEYYSNGMERHESN